MEVCHFVCVWRDGVIVLCILDFCSGNCKIKLIIIFVWYWLLMSIALLFWFSFSFHTFGGGSLSKLLKLINAIHYYLHSVGYQRGSSMQPDTLVLRGLPSRWFAETRVSSKPSMLVSHTIFSTFGNIRCEWWFLVWYSAWVLGQCSWVIIQAMLWIIIDIVVFLR